MTKLRMLFLLSTQRKHPVMTDLSQTHQFMFGLLQDYLQGSLQIDCMQLIIGQEQSAFIKGTCMADNILVASKCIHAHFQDKRGGGNRTGIALKLDMRQMVQFELKVE
ncbi:conserved hypothetical protein [Ricinus communis]|uniref:Reverse transcriptase domain-containing protein n=1 Tax=Ricinus communis TaxID=3988 RepID=B9SPK4_RICCO|nr:conserved hypothetical protein [Ricinus communis]